jgi:hypothetical protein
MSICSTGLGESDTILVVSPKGACRMLGCSITRLYELLNAREIVSYRDGKSRKILVASIRSYIDRQIAAEETKERKGWTDRATQARMSKNTVMMKPSPVVPSTAKVKSPPVPRRPSSS